MKIVQALDALDYGDGVCNDVYNKQKLFQKMGYRTEIYCKYVHEKCKDDAIEISKISVDQDDVIFFHFSNESHIVEELRRCNCRKILIYHNVTPNKFFGLDAKELTAGEKQLKEIWKEFDDIVAVSEFNKQCMKALGVECHISVIPIMLNFAKLKKYIGIEKQTGRKRFLFVGRVVANKMLEDVIKVFEYYYSVLDADCELYFVGNYQGYEEYLRSLNELLEKSTCRNRVFFTGKVEDEELYYYYATSDIFLCMSEHEGFCIPLLESMYMKLPVIAYDACAVKYTMGNAGVLLKDKQPEKVAKLCYMILHDDILRKAIIERQKRWVENFSEEVIVQELKTLLEK